MGLNVIFKDASYDIVPKQRETFDKYCKIIQWGRRNPTRFLEQFIGLSFTDHQKYVLLSSWVPSNVVWLCSRSSGKALGLDTKVYTNSENEVPCYKTVGELQVGDKIYDINGKLSEVIHLNPIIFDDYYEITFEDGEVIKCNGEHLWFVQHSNVPYDLQALDDYILLNTDSIYRNFTYDKSEFGDNYKFYVPIAKPIPNIATDYFSSQGMRKAIIDVKKVKEKIPMRCLTIDNDTGTFLCGDHFTVTHNSFMSAPFIMAKSLLIPSYKTYIMGPTGQQAQETFTKMENLAKNNIASVIGVTDVFLEECLRINAKADPFTHDKSGFHVEFYNGSEVNTLNSVAKNIVGIRSNLNKHKCSRSKKLVRKKYPSNCWKILKLN